MKILITGARGDISLALMPDLLATENELVLLDTEPMHAPEGCTSIQADLSDGAALTHAMRGCQAVIHTAAYTKDSAAVHNNQDFYNFNVTGTQNVLRAMQLNGIQHLVFTSTHLIHGDGLRGTHHITEESLCIPTDIFGFTKWMGEELCRYAARTHDFRVAILRCGDSTPTEWKSAGLNLLCDGVAREDIAQAHQLALAAVTADAFQCETFLIASATKFEIFDWPELTFDPTPVVEKHYTGATELLEHHHLTAPRVPYKYDISKAVNMLGYQPEHNFEQFLSLLRQE